MEKKLYRDESRKTIAGVCAGLAEYFGVDVILIRILFVLTLLFKGGGVLIYVIFWIIMPPKPMIFNDPTVDYTMPPQPNPNPFQYKPAKANSAGIIGGVVLVVFGTFLLLDEFNLVPDLDIGRLWPLILIAIGLGLLLKSDKKEPWEEWHKEKQDTKHKEEEQTPPANI